MADMTLMPLPMSQPLAQLATYNSHGNGNGNGNWDGAFSNWQLETFAFCILSLVTVVLKLLLVIFHTLCASLSVLNCRLLYR